MLIVYFFLASAVRKHFLCADPAKQKLVVRYDSEVRLGFATKVVYIGLCEPFNKEGVRVILWEKRGQYDSGAPDFGQNCRTEWNERN